jgi:UTP--glucose-1-phosphate uridylyltransferase
LIEAHEENECSVIGVNEVPENEAEKYGVISIDESSSTNNSFVLKDIIEKPKSNAPSNLAVVGRYVLSSKIFKYLKNLEPSVGGEVQLTDAIKLMLNDEKVMGYLYEGTKFDCGSRHGYVNAIKHLAKKMLDD